jgi:hypothetical protein
MVSVNRSCILSLRRLTMSRKFDINYLISKLVPFRFKIEPDPPDVVFSRVRVCNFLTYRYPYVEYFVSFDLVRTFDNWNVFSDFQSAL